MRSLFAAYSQGVNDGAAVTFGNPATRPELYAVLGVTSFTPWTPEDSVAIDMEFTMVTFGGEGAAGELDNAALLQKLVTKYGQQTALLVFNDLFPPAFADAPTVIPAGDGPADPGGGGSAPGYAVTGPSAAQQAQIQARQAQNQAQQAQGQAQQAQNQLQQAQGQAQQAQNEAQQANQRLASPDTSEEAIAAMTARSDQLATELTRHATALTVARTAAARELGAAVTAELAGLAMGQAQLSVAVCPTLAADGEDAARGCHSEAPQRRRIGSSRGQHDRSFASLRMTTVNGYRPWSSW